MLNADLSCVPEGRSPGVDVLSREKSGQGFAAVRRKRILVVDDDAIVLAVTSKTLSYLGYDVVAGRNGIEGLALCGKLPCDLVLTDLNMPAMDGLTLARHIKAEWPFVPVVLMTGNLAAKKNLSTQIQEGVIDEFLFKPVRLADLRGTLQRLTVPVDGSCVTRVDVHSRQNSLGCPPSTSLFLHHSRLRSPRQRSRGTT